MRWPTASRLLVAATAWLAAIPAQTSAPAAFTIDVAVAPAAARGQVPALAWLCENWLPKHTTWPATQSPRDAFHLRIVDGKPQVGPATIELPRDVVALGCCTSSGAPPALFRVATDGHEDWFLPTAFPIADEWLQLLRQLDAATCERPRTLDVAVLAGHLAGGLAEGDPHRELLQLGASLCGDVTWMAWRDESTLRVRGRSDGGLALPALLLLLAQRAGVASEGPALRAFAARDADRSEATRQLFCQPNTGALHALRAMLHADDASRLSAIDALVRLGSTADLPAIVAAADREAPWATLAAADAVRELWPAASPSTRQATRSAIARSTVIELRSIDLDRLLPTPPAPAAATAPARLRALLWLALLGILLTSLWVRERCRGAVQPA